MTKEQELTEVDAMRLQMIEDVKWQLNWHSDRLKQATKDDDDYWGVDYHSKKLKEYSLQLKVLNNK